MHSTPRVVSDRKLYLVGKIKGLKEIHVRHDYKIKLNVGIIKYCRIDYFKIPIYYIKLY